MHFGTLAADAIVLNTGHLLTQRELMNVRLKPAISEHSVALIRNCSVLMVADLHGVPALPVAAWTPSSCPKLTQNVGDVVAQVASC